MFDPAKCSRIEFNYPLTTKDPFVNPNQVGDYPFTPYEIKPVNPITPLTVPKFPYGNPFDWQQKKTEQEQKDWEEFEKWKKSKEVNIQQKKDGIHIILSCLHVPFCNYILVDKLLKFIEDNKTKIAGFHLIGDYLEMRSTSKHEEGNIDKLGMTLGKEYLEGNKVLDLFDSVLPKDIQKTYLFGNHEDNFYRYVGNVKNHKIADALQAPDIALNLRARGYTVYNNWKEDFVQIGSYQVLHGVYTTTNSSKAHLDKLRKNCLFGHTHRLGNHFDAGLHALNIGCLIDLNSPAFGYVSRVEKMAWRNGFGIITVQGEDSCAEVIPCANDCFFYGGKKY